MSFSKNQKIMTGGLIINFFMLLVNFGLLYVARNQQTVIRQDIDNFQSKFADIDSLKSEVANIKSLEVDNFITTCPEGTTTTTIEGIILDDGRVGTTFGCVEPD